MIECSEFRVSWFGFAELAGVYPAKRGLGSGFQGENVLALASALVPRVKYCFGIIVNQEILN